MPWQRHQGNKARLQGDLCWIGVTASREQQFQISKGSQLDFAQIRMKEESQRKNRSYPDVFYEKTSTRNITKFYFIAYYA